MRSPIILPCALSVLLLAFCLTATAQPTISRMDISARLVPEAHSLEATATLTVTAGSSLRLQLNPALSISNLTLDGQIVPTEGVMEGTGSLEVALPGGACRLSLSYSGSLWQDASATRFSREALASEIVASIGAEGAFLSPSAAWYPMVEGVELCDFELRIETPAGWEAVSEGERVEHRETGSGVLARYRSELPLDGVHLVAGPYKVIEQAHGDTTLYAFLYEEDLALAEPYLGDVARYLDLYEALLGPYPFRKFAVVEAFFPAGYGMASFTYLGQDVMRLPFIRFTSLGHEVCHCWWGNGVLVDWTLGNWCEGLTTYLADYLYEEQKGPAEARDYRRRVLADYASYVGAGEELPLSAFTGRHDFATRATGYGKCAMVFHMLRVRFGDEHFFAALRRLTAGFMGRAASWDDIRGVFEQETGVGLEETFDYWVRQPGVPALALASVSRCEGGVAIGVAADGATRLTVPYTLTLADGRTLSGRLDEVQLGPEPTRFELAAPAPVARVTLDPDFDIMRRLAPVEVPATLRVAFGAEPLRIVLPASADDDMLAAYERLVQGFAERLEVEVVAADAYEGPVADSVVVLLGTPAENPHVGPILAAEPRVACGPGSMQAGGVVVEGAGGLLVVATKLGDEGVALVIAGASPAAVDAAGYKLLHYGRYGMLLFDAGQNVAKGVLDAPITPLSRPVE